MLDDELYNKRVLIIGDSFTCPNTDTWLHMLQQRYKWSVINKSVGGSGCKYAWYTFIKNVKDFDVCIFSWSESTRMFHKHLPWLNSSEAKLEHQKPGNAYTPTYKAANLYYQYLMDMEFDDYLAKAMLFWLDAELGNSYSDKMFFHFHSFPAGDAYVNTESGISDLMHIFKTGITVAPSLYKLSQQDPQKPSNYAIDKRAGHLGKDYHIKLFNQLIAYATTNEYKNSDIIQLDLSK